MNEHEHRKDPHPAATPIVPAAPVVDPTTGPVTPINPEFRSSPNPYPYIAGLVLLVLGLWGLFAFTERDERQMDNARVGYIEQDLQPAPAPLATSAPARPTSDRVRQDRATDRLSENRREQIIRDEETVVIQPSTSNDDYDNEVASINLSDPLAVPDVTQQPTAGTSDTTVTPDIAVIDLDYKNTAVTPMTEAQVATMLEQMDTELDATENLADERDQTIAFEILDERWEMLEDRIEDTPKPMTETNRLMITRQLTELRDELTAFQKSLASL